MEEQTQPHESGLFGLNIDQASRMHLLETAKWGRFLAILGFVFCGLFVVVGIFMTTMFSTMDRTYGTDMPAGFARTFGPAFFFVYLVLAVMYFFPCLFLLRFSNKMRIALTADNQSELTASFQNLKVLFRYIGILMIVVLSFYIIAIFFVGVGAALSR